MNGLILYTSECAITSKYTSKRVNCEELAKRHLHATEGTCTIPLASRITILTELCKAFTTFRFYVFLKIFRVNYWRNATNCAVVRGAVFKVCVPKRTAVYACAYRTYKKKWCRVCFVELFHLHGVCFTILWLTSPISTKIYIMFVRHSSYYRFSTGWPRNPCGFEIDVRLFGDRLLLVI